jgi:hypothetical protein
MQTYQYYLLKLCLIVYVYLYNKHLSDGVVTVIAIIVTHYTYFKSQRTVGKCLLTVT